MKLIHLLLLLLLFFSINAFSQVVEEDVERDELGRLTEVELRRLDIALPVIEEALTTVVLPSLKYYCADPDSMIVTVGIYSKDKVVLWVSSSKYKGWEPPCDREHEKYVGYVSLPHCIVLVQDLETPAIPKYFQLSEGEDVLHLRSNGEPPRQDGAYSWGFFFDGDDCLKLYIREGFPGRTNVNKLHW